MASKQFMIFGLLSLILNSGFIEGNLYFTDLLDHTHGQGEEIHLENSVSNLKDDHFDNKTQQACVKGIWLYYDHPNFNSEHSSAVVWGMAVDKFCFILLKNYRNLTSSVKLIGPKDTWNGDSLVLFSKSIYQGKDVILESESTDLTTIDIESMALTGVAPWTVYSEVNYNGKSACIYPNSYTVSIGMKRLASGFYPNLKDLSFSGVPVSSAKKGCYSDNMLNNETVKEFTHGANGVFNEPDNGKDCGNGGVGVATLLPNLCILAIVFVNLFI